MKQSFVHFVLSSILSFGMFRVSTGFAPTLILHARKVWTRKSNVIPLFVLQGEKQHVEIKKEIFTDITTKSDVPYFATDVSKRSEDSTSHAVKSYNCEKAQPSSQVTKNKNGLPWWWEMVWDLDMMKRGEPGTDIIFGDSAHVLRTNIEQIYGDYPSLDGCTVAEGEINDIADGTMFIGLQRYFEKYGSPYKLCFGPKSFLVISDPVQARHVLRDRNVNYDKGILAEILKPIMGKGLIPADPKTWSVRRRAIVPAFHKAWLDHMVRSHPTSK